MTTSAAAASLVLRPLTAEDGAALQDYLAGLPAADRRCRFHASVNPRSPALLQRLLTVQPGRDIAVLLAVLRCADGDIVVGEARLSLQRPGVAEFAISVATAQQGSGLAQRLLQALREAAAEAGVHELVADVLDSNDRMAAFMRRQGFEPCAADADGEDDVRRWTARVVTPHEAPAAVPPVWTRLRGWLQRRHAAA